MFCATGALPSRYLGDSLPYQPCLRKSQQEPRVHLSNLVTKLSCYHFQKLVEGRIVSVGALALLGHRIVDFIHTTHANVEACSLASRTHATNVSSTGFIEISTFETSIIVIELQASVSTAIHPFLCL